MKIFCKLLTLSFLLTGLSFANAADNETLTKRQKWEQTSFEIDCMTDGLGRPIDPKIKEAVIALNVLGIPTTASCEGHLNRGFSYPWIEFDCSNTPQIEALTEYYISLLDKEKLTEKLIETKYAYLSYAEQLNQPEGQLLLNYREERWEVLNKIFQEKEGLLQNINVLLKQFYRKYTSSYDCMLFISRGENVARIQSIGGDWQVLRTDEKKEIKLNKYQAEMNKFAHFLKNYFYQTE